MTMKLLNELINLFEAKIASKNEIEKAINIINKYTTPENPFNDILIRVMGFTSGFTKPDQNKDEAIDIIPVLDDLKRNGLVSTRGKDMYKRSDALSQLMRNHILKDMNRVIGGITNSDGRLSLEQVERLSTFVSGGSRDIPLGDRLNNSINSWKSGGKHSGDVKSIVKDTIKQDDPEYKNLPESSKNMLNKLSTLSDPYNSFHVLKYILHLQKSKKGYTSFIKEIENYFTNEKYIDALYGLVDLGVIDSASGNKINNSVVSDIRNAINFLKQETVQNISLNDKLSAFLPNFSASATSSSASLHRGINELLKKPGFVDIIINRLNSEKFENILNANKEELKGVSLDIRNIADAFNISDLNEFQNKITTLVRNRVNYKGDENISAKNTGRFDEFIRKFSI